MPPPPRAAGGTRHASAAAPAPPITELTSVVLVKGAEAVLADRAVAGVLELARLRDPAVEITHMDAAAYSPGQLELATSPSLFDEQRCVLVSAVERATEAFVADALAYVERPAPDVVLVLRHAGGQRGKRLLDVIARIGTVVECEPIKRDADKVAFAEQELKRAGRRAEAKAIRALVDAVGTDLQELVSACAQLVADTTGTITQEVVHRYHGGRVEASGFAVADAALVGNGAEALRLLRHALATGLDPVPLVAVLAARLRLLAKVAATRGRGSGAVRELGLASWQLDKARRELSGWTPEGLAAAITAVAAADAEVKGAARDAGYAVERAVLRIVGAHGRDRHAQS